MKHFHYFVLLVFLYTGFLLPVHSREVREQVCAGEIRQTMISNAGPSADIDNDGRTEMVGFTTARGEYESETYWYSLEYDSSSHEYLPDYVSELSGNKTIRRISLLDIDSDGNTEVILVRENSGIEVYDGTTKEMEFSVTVVFPQYSSDREILKIMFADADNDGITEVVFLSGDHLWLYLPSADGLTLKNEYPYGGYDVEFGNVDTQPDVEAVFANGKVVRINGEAHELLWTVPDLLFYGKVELIDVDSDSMDEVIIITGNLEVWNADVHELIYEDYIGTSTLLSWDTNGDGIKELIHDADHKINCLNSATGEEIWSFNNPSSRAYNLSINDTDNDGDEEIYWTGDASSDGSIVYVYDLITHEQEWHSVNLIGSFTQVRVADVDNDGSDELITLSRESENGYGDCVMTIFDAATNNMEWQSTPLFFNHAWNAYDFITADIDHDDTTEIILASERGRIYIINGISHRLQADKGFSSVSYFYSLTLADTDNDGNEEYVLCSHNKVYIIDPATWAIEWTSPEFSYTSGYFSHIAVSNVDTDPAPEIIFLHSGELSVIDGFTRIAETLPEKEITSFYLLDEDSDGIKEIFAGTLSGKIGIMRGPEYNMEWSSIAMENRILDLHVADLHPVTGNELVFFSDGTLWFSTLTGEMQGSERISNTDMKYENIELADYNGDGKYEIFAGTSYLVTELEYDCYKCMAINVELQQTHLTCEAGNNGSIQATVSNGSSPLTYQWSNGMTGAMIAGLAPGIYSVTVSDQQGCEDTATINVEQLYLQANIHAVRKGCTNQYPGGITTEIVKGKAPFTYLWSNGATTPSLTDPPEGTYSVIITDANNCTRELTARQIKDTVILNTKIEPASCKGNGYMEVIATGYPPYNYLWSHGSMASLINAPQAGTYTVTVSDNYECSSTMEVVFPEYVELDMNATLIPDNPSTPEPDGVIIIEPVGGTPPYRMNWPLHDPPEDQMKATGLEPGYYWLTIWDAYDCHKQAEFKLDAGIPEKKCSIYPIPAHDRVTIDLSGNVVQMINARADFYNISGIRELSVNLPSVINDVDISKLSSGLHFVKIIIDGDEQTLVMERVKYRKKE